MPPILIVLAIIALVLHILWAHVLPPQASSSPYSHQIISVLVIILVIVLWVYAPAVHGH